jgi:hypothetical protein
VSGEASIRQAHDASDLRSGDSNGPLLHAHNASIALRHFAVFERSVGHCVLHLLRAESLRGAMTGWARSLGAEILEDGSIRTDDGYGGKIVYAHPLEFVELEYKTLDGQHGRSWEVLELCDAHWEASYTDAFCSADPNVVDGYICRCRPALREAFPTSRARAFVWYLKDGPLVTFHRRLNPRRRWPAEIIARYLLPWNDWGRVQPWNGSRDEVLAQMAVDVPLP